jgi:uncharacterized protein (DUF1499 family)
MDPALQPTRSYVALAIYARVTFALALAAALAALVSGPGNRFGWWGFSTAFGILRWAAAAGGFAAVLCAVAALLALRSERAVPMALSFIGLLCGLVTFGLPLPWLQGRDSLPSIHDISTDTRDPPRFVALAAVRARAPNGADYGGPAVAAAQRDAYPDIGSMSLAVPPPEAYLESLRVVRALGWEVAPSEPGALRIEASDTTLFFGATGDIVIRITPAGPVSRVDVRSMSRAGRGDLGINARRIRDFYRLLQRVQFQPGPPG